MINSNAQNAEAREKIVTIFMEHDGGSPGNLVGPRCYPPPSADWRLVDARYEVVAAINTGAGNPHIQDAGGNDAVTAPDFSAGKAAGQRGQFTLSGTEASLNIHGSSNQGNAYHQFPNITVASGAGKLLLFLYYRSVQVSGDLSLARTA